MDPKHKNTPASAEEHAIKTVDPQDAVAEQIARRQREAEEFHVEHTERVLGWLRKNAIPMASGVVLVMVAIAGYAWVSGSNEKAELQARNTLMSASNAQELQDLAANHPGSRVAPLALLRAAQVNFEQGEYAKAREGFAAMMAKHGTHELAPTAEYGLAKCLDAEGKTEEALKAYDEFLKKHPGNPLAADAGFARILVLDGAGRTDEAKTSAENFIATEPAMPWKEEAKTLLERIQSKIDRVANPVIPPPPPAPAPAPAPVTPAVEPPAPAPAPETPAPAAEPPAPVAETPAPPPAVEPPAPAPVVEPPAPAPEAPAPEAPAPEVPVPAPGN